jgi:hypothetical protein
MASNVYELTGSMSNLVSDTELVFPNVQTCVAVVAQVGNSLLGAHVTIADRGRLSELGQRFAGNSPSALYVVGPIFGTYNVSSFANFGAPTRVFDTPGYIDVRARVVGATVEVSTRPSGAVGWTVVPLQSFHQ